MIAHDRLFILKLFKNSKTIFINSRQHWKSIKNRVGLFLVGPHIA